MKRRIVFFAAFLSLVLAFGAFFASADTRVRLYVNGTELNYSGHSVMPVIINSRAVIPALYTMSELGAAAYWDASSMTLTAVRNGVTSTHSVYSNVMMSDGVLKQYPAPSTVIDGVIMLPTAMLADILGCDSRWDDLTASVIMTQKKAQIFTAATNKSRLMAGEELIVSVITSDTAKSVDLYDNGGRLLSSSSSPVKVGANNSFTLRYSPVTETSAAVQYKVQTGDSYKNFPVTVTAGSRVVNAFVNESSSYLNENTKITVTASDRAERIRLTDTSTGRTYEKSSYTSSGGNRVFVFDIKMTERGDKTFSIETGSLSSYVKDSRTVSFNVLDERAQTAVSIRDITFNNRVYGQSETVNVTVRTSTSATELEVYDSQTRNTSRFTSYSESSGYRTFDISVRTSTWGTNSFTVSAYDRDGRRAQQSFSVSTDYYGNNGYWNNGNYDYDYWYDWYYNNGYWNNGNYNYDDWYYWYYILGGGGNGYYNDPYYNGSRYVRLVGHSKDGDSRTVILRAPYYSYIEVGYSGSVYYAQWQYQYGNEGEWKVTVPYTLPYINVYMTDSSGYKISQTIHF